MRKEKENNRPLESEDAGGITEYDKELLNELRLTVREMNEFYDKETFTARDHFRYGDLRAKLATLLEDARRSGGDVWVVANNYIQDHLLLISIF